MLAPGLGGSRWRNSPVCVFVVMGVIFAWSRGVGSWVGGGSCRAWKCRETQSRSCAALAQAGGGCGEEGGVHGALWPAGNWGGPGALGRGRVL